MNELTLKTTEMFGEVQTDIYENENCEMFMTAEQLGECLGYADPIRSISKLATRNSYLKNEEFSRVVNLTTVDGKQRDVRVYNEDGIYEATFMSNTKKAKEFRHWVRRLLKSLRAGNLQLTNNNATFSPQIIESIMQKYFNSCNNRLFALETKKPTQPNYWLWKKHIANPVIQNLSDTLHLDMKATFALVYDTMSAEYGFDKSFSMNQFCVKYEVNEVSTIDAIADVPEYQKWFIDTAKRLISNTVCTPIDNATVVYKSSYDKYDKVSEAIQPLIVLYNDKSANGAKTYGKVYAAMMSKRTWKSLMTRYKCSNKKQILTRNEKYFKKFCECVDELLSNGRGDTIEAE